MNDENLYARNPDGSLITHDSKGRKIKRDKDNKVISVGDDKMPTKDAAKPTTPADTKTPPAGTEYPRGKQVPPEK
jgi:hypothetical protein